MSIKRADGFTIIEIIIVTVVIAIIIPLIFYPLDGLYTSTVRNNQEAIQATDVRSALRSVADTVSSSAGFDHTISTAVPYGSSDGTSWNWTGSSVNKRVLIVKSYATTKLENADTEGARRLVFAASDCMTPIKNHVVFFVDSSNTLYRRTITDKTTPQCGGTVMAQKQTCSITGKNGHPSTCSGIDALLAKNVTKFKVNYFAAASDRDPLNKGGGTETLYTDNTVPGVAKSVSISLEASIGPDSTTNNTIRATIVN